MGWFRKLSNFLNIGADARIHEKDEWGKRQNTPIVFKPPLTAKKFSDLAYSASERINGLKIKVDHQFVIGFVKTSDGASKWSFKLDYNDFGQITGNCWIVYQDYDESKIPNRFHRIFSRYIKNEIRSERIETNVSEEGPAKRSCCGNNISDQRDFDENLDHYESSKYRKAFFNSTICCDEKFPGIDFFCNECNDLLNKQEGFIDSCGEWKCRKCGHINKIDSEHIDHKMTLGFSEMQIIMENYGVTDAECKTINETKTKTAKWQEIELAIDRVFKEFDKIYYESKRTLHNATVGQKIVIDDLVVELKPDDRDYPSLLFAPYQGFLYESDDGYFSLFKEEDFDYLNAVYVKRLFKEFYDSGKITLDPWWDR